MQPKKRGGHARRRRIARIIQPELNSGQQIRLNRIENGNERRVMQKGRGVLDRRNFTDYSPAAMRAGMIGGIIFVVGTVI